MKVQFIYMNISLNTKTWKDSDVECARLPIKNKTKLDTITKFESTTRID